MPFKVYAYIVTACSIYFQETFYEVDFIKVTATIDLTLFIVVIVRKINPKPEFCSSLGIIQKLTEICVNCVNLV